MTAPDPLPTAVPASGDQVKVSRQSVEQLIKGIGALVAMVVAFGLVFAWDSWQDGRKDARQDATDQHLVETDDRLEATADALEAFVAAEAREDEIEQAQACIQSHVRFAGLQELLRRIGERTDMTDEEVASILDGWPPPSCDLKAAQAVLQDS